MVALPQPPVRSSPTLTGLKPATRVTVRESTELQLLITNMAHPLFSQPVVRQAIALAVDREALNEAGWYGHAQVMHRVFPPVFGLTPTPRRHPDLARARDLLEQDGWELNSRGVRERDRRELRSVIVVDERQSDLVAMARCLVSQLHEIGIALTVRRVSQIERHLTRHVWALALHSVNALKSGNYGTIAERVMALDFGENLAQYESPQLEELRASLMIELNDLRRRELAEAFQERLEAEAVLIPLLVPPRISKIDVMDLLTKTRRTA